MATVEDVKIAETVEGEDKALEKLLPWLRKLAEGLETESDMEIVLYEVTKHGLEQMQSFPFDPADDSVDDLVRELMNVALEDVEERKQRVRYAVMVDGRKDKKTFTLKATRAPDDDEDVDDLDDFDEPPNAKGQIALALDQSFRWGKLALRETRENRKIDRDRIRSLEAENQSLRRLLAEQYRIVEKAHSQTFLRELELKKFDKSEARKDKIAEGALQIGLPAVISHFSKQPMAAFMRPPPGMAPPSSRAPSPETSASPSAASSEDVERMRAEYDRKTGDAFDALFRTFTEEQFPKLLAYDGLTQEQKEKLVEIIKLRVELDAILREASSGSAAET